MILSLHELEPNQEADFFARLTEKEPAKTKEGKPYLWVTFRDAHREVRFPVWSETAVYKEFKTLKSGMYCKLRAVYRVTPKFGTQLDILRIRPVEPGDEQDGFNETLLYPAAALPADKMFDELQALSAAYIGKGKLLQIVTKILKEYRMTLLTGVASRQHHHNYIGGLLEHTLSVTKIAAAIADHYHQFCPERAKDIARR
jgi:3'-5' exoribonuclease